MITGHLPACYYETDDATYVTTIRVNDSRHVKSQICTLVCWSCSWFKLKAEFNDHRSRDVMMRVWMIFIIFFKSKQVNCVSNQHTFNANVNHKKTPSSYFNPNSFLFKALI